MIWASNFKYLNFSFQKFNPVQQQAYQYYDKDCNLVVSSTMASGKTTIAQMILSYQIIQKKSKCIYISPLCQLTEQIRNKWCQYQVFRNNLSNLSFFTVEGLDVAIRKKYIKQLDVIIFDQAHIIDSDGRGSNAQILIKRIAKLYPNCRIVLLSGTMSNAVQIAKWIKSLNKKTTFVIRSDWRPVDNIKNIVIYSDQNNKYEQLYELLEKNSYDKIVVFVYSKNNGKQLSKKLNKYGINSAFISSDISKGKRNKILNAFRQGQINILISTSLLSQGVNLG